MTPTEEALSRLAAERNSVAAGQWVVVTILGDGRNTIGYEKRLEVKEHLSQIEGVVEVNVPELLYEEHEKHEVEDIELAAIQTAHVVICLEPPDKHPLGMYTEMERYFSYDEAGKWLWIYPEDRPDPRADGSMVAAIAQNVVQCMEQFEYREGQWWQCSRIRAACAKKVSRALALEREKQLAEIRKSNPRSREA